MFSGHMFLMRHRTRCMSCSFERLHIKFKRGFFWPEIYLLLSDQIQQNCINCGVCMGKYFCQKCKFFDDDVCCVEFIFTFFHCISNLPISMLFLIWFTVVIRSQRNNTTVMDVEYVGTTLSSRLSTIFHVFLVH